MSSQAQASLAPQLEDIARTLILADAEIAPLAYEYRHQRGCPDGSSEEDWFRAEQELIARRRNEEASHDPA